MTSGSAQDLADKQSSAAVASVLTPYCVLKSQTDPNRVAVQAELDAASSYQRTRIIEKAGWATPMGMEKPDSQLARSCLTALEAKT